MKLRKLLLYCIAILSLLALTLFIVINSWTNTPYGKLDPKVAILLKYIEFAKIDLFEKGRSPEDIRRFSKNSSKFSRGTPAQIESVSDRTIPGPAGQIPVRIYNHGGPSSSATVVYYHGGGWVIGDLDTQDNICRAIAKKASAVVVSVDYRLAPENIFPAAFDDAYAALLWVKENINNLGGNPSKIFVAGDSAGGNLSAAVSIAARDRNGPKLRGQILIYPATNLSKFDTDSHNNFGKGFYLTERYMKKFREYYMPDQDLWTNIYASPYLAKSLKNLPPAFILTAQFDVLRDEGEAYARRLKSEGVLTIQTQYVGRTRGFLSMDGLFNQANHAFDEIAEFIKQTGNVNN